MAPIVDLSRPNYQAQAIAQFLQQMAENSRNQQMLSAKRSMDDQNNTAALIRTMIQSGDVESAQKLAEQSGQLPPGINFVNMKQKMLADKQAEEQAKQQQYMGLFQPQYGEASPAQISNPDLSSQIKLAPMPPDQYGPGQPMIDQRPPLNERLAQAMQINPPKNEAELKAMIAALSSNQDVQNLNAIGIGTKMNAKDQASADLARDRFNQVDLPVGQADVRQKNAATANDYSQINARNAKLPGELQQTKTDVAYKQALIDKAKQGATAGPLKVTPSEQTALGFYMLAKDAADVATQMEPWAEKRNWLQQVGDKYTLNVLASDQQQQMRQVASQFTEARLRKVSGATIKQEEYDNDFRMFFPQPGDSKATLQRKAKARSVILDSLRRQSGNAALNYENNVSGDTSSAPVYLDENGHETTRP